MYRYNGHRVYGGAARGSPAFGCCCLVFCFIVFTSLGGACMTFAVGFVSGGK